jgi:hypothetical protein
MLIPGGLDKVSGDPSPGFGDIFRPVLCLLFQEVQYSGEAAQEYRMSLTRVVEPAMDALDMIRGCANVFRPAYRLERLGIESTFPHFWENVEVR